MPRKVKMFASRKLITKCSSEPNLLDECPADLPHTFIGTEPSHVTRLLRESTPHTTNITGSTLSLVPGPSLTHSTQSLNTQSLTTHTTTLKPVYIIPPEVEKVAVRLSRSPQPTRKPPVPERLNSATSVSSFGSASSGQRHLSESFEPALTMETDQPSPGLRTIARIKGTCASVCHSIVWLKCCCKVFSNIGKMPQSGNVSLALLLKYFNALVRIYCLLSRQLLFFSTLRRQSKACACSRQCDQ